MTALVYLAKFSSLFLKIKHFSYKLGQKESEKNHAETTFLKHATNNKQFSGHWALKISNIHFSLFQMFRSPTLMDKSTSPWPKKKTPNLKKKINGWTRVWSPSLNYPLPWSLVWNRNSATKKKSRPETWTTKSWLFNDGILVMVYFNPNITG